ncbi:MAG TPA: hypothetical protein VEQ36_15530 [Thermomicrobiales bacterium]|nr:hypothetical protein [Thermomicrobiales bacterium]
MSTYVETPRLGESIGPEWRAWGPYLSERQWGTVREDYSESGAAWDFFPHEQSRSRAYRWGEDGLLGLSDDKQRLCLALAIWNGSDPILKERLFGLTGSEGNHGEDVKEYYYYLDATPTHSYLRGLYKYPQRAFPYGDLLAVNRERGREHPEYELVDTGIFSENRYFDIEVEYAKVAPDDIFVRISATNRGPEAASLHMIPTLWFRNTWSWGRDDHKPQISATPGGGGAPSVRAVHHELGTLWLACEGAPDLLFTENETNAARLWGGVNPSPFVKDGIDQAIVHGLTDAVNPDRTGTKFGARYRVTLAPGATQSIQLRLSPDQQNDPFKGAELVFDNRRAEADEFYATLSRGALTEDEARVERQALAGLIWSKQVYNFDVAQWLEGDPAGPPPPEGRKHGRNSQWLHHNSNDVISMPDKWEYPWYAAWDLAFHCVAFGLVDEGFAKDQLLLMLREWYMHPNGQLPAYEWAFGDVNPPVHIAATRVLFEAERQRGSEPDRRFLARVFHKLLLNFTWWVNRKDEEGNNVFQGGFLGLDNISVIDRSMVMPEGVTLEQADGTAWMASYCLNMAWAALELSMGDPAYEDLATKFLEHYLAIGGAMNGLSGEETTLWDEEDGFYYDFLRRADGLRMPLKLRSLVGLLPIVPSVALVENELTDVQTNAPNFMRQMKWYAERHPELARLFPMLTMADGSQHRLLQLVPEDRLRRILTRMFDQEEFLSDYGIRSISRHYLEHPYELKIRDLDLTVTYEPAESSTGMFGGNSNWRGPIWFPTNILLIHGLRNLHRGYGDDFLVEYPTGSGQQLTLAQIADDLSRRLTSVFLEDQNGIRPVFGGVELMQRDPHWHDHLLFYEYFHGDNGAGIGASHQTGWTALVANLLDRKASASAPMRELASAGRRQSK